MSIIAGSYTVTFNGVSLGVTELDSVRLSFTPEYEDILGDNYGASIQDGVYRGGNCYVDMVLLEWYRANSTLNDVMTAFWPYITNTTANWGQTGTIGVLASSLAKTLVLTAVAGTPAASSPATLTNTAAILPRGFPLDLLFAPRVRKVPLRFILFPYLSSTTKWFAVT